MPGHFPIFNLVRILFLFFLDRGILAEFWAFDGNLTIKSQLLYQLS
jgi:hypothetical protein